MSDTTDGNRGGPPGTAGMLVFLLLFLIPAALTYLSPLFRLGEAAGAENWVADAFLLICYGVMTFACWLRGKAVGRVWLVAFPIIGGLFDIILVYVPFVPTIMNIVVLAAGIPQKSQPT